MSYHSVLRAIAILLLSVTTSWAGWPYDCVGDMNCYQGKSTRHPGQEDICGGSGTLVGVNADYTKGVIVTCAHTFDDGRRLVTITFPGGRGKFKCTLAKIDYQRDISVWTIDNPPKDIGTPAAFTTVRAEDGPFTAVGFPSYGKGGQHFSTGNFISWADNGYEIYVNSDVHSGYSGGALFNKYGEYCGIVCGNTPVLKGRANPWGKWESRHTAGPQLLDIVDDYLEVKP